MSEDFYTLAIAALLPLTACLLALQKNPYHALVVRGILGAIAALVYALFGAADVALTEALVGTMLSITLYAVAVRSSMSMRLGVLEADSQANPAAGDPATGDPAAKEPVLAALREILRRHYMRLEPVIYKSKADLKTALANREIHTALLAPTVHTPSQFSSPDRESSHIQTRVQRLYDIMQAELPPNMAKLTYAGSAIASQSATHPLETLKTAGD